jgi:hypothetical protein
MTTQMEREALDDARSSTKMLGTCMNYSLPS